MEDYRRHIDPSIFMRMTKTTWQLATLLFDILLATMNEKTKKLQKCLHEERFYSANELLEATESWTVFQGCSSEWLERFLVDALQTKSVTLARFCLSRGARPTKGCLKFLFEEKWMTSFDAILACLSSERIPNDARREGHLRIVASLWVSLYTN